MKTKLGIAEYILAAAFLTGQLSKLPFGNLNVATLLDVAVLGYVLFMSVWQKGRIGSPPVFVKIGFCFGLVGLLSLVISPLHLSTGEFLVSLLYIGRFWSYLVFGWIVYRRWQHGPMQADSLLLICGSGLALLGLLQLIFYPSLIPLAQNGWDPHVGRVVSTFLDPNFSGTVYALCLVLLFTHKKVIPSRKLGWILFGLIYLALLCTFSRGSYLMLAVCFGLLTILQRSLKNVILTCFMIGGLGLGYLHYHQTVVQTYHVDRAQSAQLRLTSWQQGEEIFRHAPLLGVGFNSYRYALAEYQLAPTSQIGSRGASSNDSSLLFVLATTGVVGMSVYLLFVGTLLKLGVAQLNRDQGRLLVSFVGLLVGSFFINSLFYPFVLFWLVIICAQASLTKQSP